MAVFGWSSTFTQAGLSKITLAQNQRFCLDVTAYKMHATLHDVCKKAGVSTATVSRVINHSQLVTEQTRARVQDAMRALRYRPSHAARTLARQRTDLIGVVFPE